MNTSKLHAVLGFLAVSGSLAVLGAGCSSSNNTNNTPTNGASSGIGGSTNTTGGATGGDTGGTTDTSGGDTSTGGSNGTGGATSACVPDTSLNCYSCDPTTNDQFLNHCSPTATCQKFDNAAKGVPASIPAIP